LGTKVTIWGLVSIAGRGRDKYIKGSKVIETCLLLSFITLIFPVDLSRVRKSANFWAV